MPGHEHQLDVDSRHVIVLQLGIETNRHAILRGLEKRTSVVAPLVQGNQDPQVIWLLVESRQTPRDERQFQLHRRRFGWVGRVGGSSSGYGTLAEKRIRPASTDPAGPSIASMARSAAAAPGSVSGTIRVTSALK